MSLGLNGLYMICKCANLGTPFVVPPLSVDGGVAEREVDRGERVQLGGVEYR